MSPSISTSTLLRSGPHHFPHEDVLPGILLIIQIIQNSVWNIKFNEISNTFAKRKQTLSNRVLENDLVWCVGTEGESIEVDYSGWNGKLYLGGGRRGLKRQDEARLSTSLNKFDLHFTGIRERKRWGKLCYGICFASEVQDKTRSRDWLGGCDRRR